MTYDIIKRNGSIESFDKQKIINAINKAFISTDGILYEEDTAQTIADEIEEKVRSAPNGSIAVEDIQDWIEDALMLSERRDVAKAYIRYRYKREIARNAKDDFIKAIREKLDGTKIENQNANVDEHSFGGRTGEASDIVTKQLALDYIVSPMSRANHLNNEIYIHDLGSYYVGSHNCFHSDTKFITSQGVQTFSNYKNNDQITILAPDGIWRPATVKYYGKQNLYKYTFKKNRTEKIIYATPNHRWILEDGSFQEGLKVGDKIFESPYYWNDFNFEELSKEGKFYWCLGFIYGDGTIETRYSKKEKQYYKAKTCKVKLCGNKVNFLPRFQELGYGINCWAEEPEVGRIPYDKKIPDFNNLSIECLVAFIHGYYDADGTKSFAPNTGKQIYGIQATGKEACDFIEKYFPVAGLYINSIVDKTGQETNFGVRKYTKNYAFFAEASNKYHWYVKDIEEDDTLQDVWCLQVPEVHAFVLDGGIPTGNCLSIPFDDLLKNGFNTRQTDVRPAQSINTAFQLVAVIFQLQSLNQFGGVSSTHLDWTMVPYVRKSFSKHMKDGLRYIEHVIDEEYIHSVPNELKFDDLEANDSRHAEVYKYAMEMTERECAQASEGLFHNLNTLQSRSGN